MPCLRCHLLAPKSLQIKHFIEGCDTPEILSLPWEKIGCDFIDFNNNKYLVTVDYYSKYIEMPLLASTNANNITLHCKSIFSHHGVSDGDPPFNSKEFYGGIGN